MKLCNECGRPLSYQIETEAEDISAPDNLGPWDRAVLLSQSEQRRQKARLTENTND